MKCKIVYKARLAVVENLDVAEFLAEALSETDLKTDSLWVGSVYNEFKKIWVWNIGDQEKPISTEINATMKVNEDVKALDRKCLAFARSNHSKPELRPLPCFVFRGYICERPRKESMYTFNYNLIMQEYF